MEELQYMTEQQRLCFETFKKWVEEETAFYGNPDEEYLYLFWHSCDYDLELSKLTLTSHYKVKHTYSQIWRNRNLSDEFNDSLIKQRIVTVLTNSSPEQPIVAVLSMGRIVPPYSNNLDHLLKAASFVFDLIIANRRRNCLNGWIVVFDYKDYDWRFIIRCISPLFVKKLIENFVTPIPGKLKYAIAVNAPFIAMKLIQLFYPFMPSKYKDATIVLERPQMLANYVPVELLPLEYEGNGSPIKHHEDAFESELRRFNDYLLDDEKYGYR